VTEEDVVLREHEEACPWDTETAETDERTYPPREPLQQQAIDTSERYKRHSASDTSDNQRAYE
jgi:hypothetical protein